MRSRVAQSAVWCVAGAMLLACSDTTAPGPSAPEGVAASLSTPTSVLLTWTARPRAEKVTAYAVYRNGVRIGETPETSFTDSNLAEKVTLSYSVSSMIESGYESSQSAAVSITTQDVVPPRIVQYLPANGSGPLYWENITVSLVFSEAMDSSSFNSGTFAVTAGPAGPQVEGAIAYFKTAHVAEFRGPFGRLPPATTIVVTASGMKDLSGNVMTSPLTFSFTTTENVPPYIVSTVPANNATEVPLDAEVRVTFSEPMNLETLGTRVFDLSSNLPGDFVATTGSWDPATNTQILRGGYKSKHRYQVIVGAYFPAKDLSGNRLAPPTDFVFTTLDAGPPVAAALSPSPEETGVDPATQVRITFNEPLDESTIAPENFIVYGWQGEGLVAGTVSYDAATYTVIFTPLTPLAAGTKYGVSLHGVKDATGVAQEDYINYGFTTK